MQTPGRAHAHRAHAQVAPGSKGGVGWGHGRCCAADRSLDPLVKARAVPPARPQGQNRTWPA
jgi:hypothetical protein